MSFLREVLAIVRMEFTLFGRFPKLRTAALGVMLIPALYALIYLSSVRDPGAHTGELKVAIVNLDQGLDYRGQHVNMGLEVETALLHKRTFGYVDMAAEEEARAAVRLGQLAFALIIPRDFSANAVPGHSAAGGRLVLYVSEGNNYNGAALAKRFAAELGHQVNIDLNEKRWSLVLSTATGSIDKLEQLHKGVHALQDGAHSIDAGLAKAESGAKSLALGADGLSAAVGQLTDGVKQLGAGLRAMDQQRPAKEELAALRAGAEELVAGHASLDQGLSELQGGAQKIAEGASHLRDETKGIPLIGGRISEGAGQLATGSAQLDLGLQNARGGQAQLADGALRLSTGVGKLTDGVTALGNGIHTAAGKVPTDAKLDELATGGRNLARASQELRSGMTQLRTGSRELAGGVDLLKATLPKDISAPDGSARGLADSVEPAVEIVAPVPNYGAGFAPNFLATSLWMGAVMSALLFHLRRLPLAARPASRSAHLMGKLGIPLGIVAVQSVTILLMTLFLLDLHIVQLPQFMATLLLASVSFLLIIVALTRALGDAGKAAALILLILQLSSAGGVLPVELSGGVYQMLSPWLPFTWVIKALRASMFGAFNGEWLMPWLVIALVGSLTWLVACFVGTWQFVGPDEHRPALDI